MSPEERSEKLQIAIGQLLGDIECQAILAIIDADVAEEREACLAIALDHAESRAAAERVTRAFRERGSA